MIAVPADAPVTIPVDEPMPATPVELLDQTPPEVESVSVIVPPIHMGTEPTTEAGPPITVSI